MRFDSAIIGGGLAGLVCGISMAKRGKKCIILSSGQSAMQFSSGSFDLLSRLPDGAYVPNPMKAIEELSRQSPLHPYAKIGVERFEDLAMEAKRLLSEIGVSYDGDATRNHFRISPRGETKPTWLSNTNTLYSEDSCTLPFQQTLLCNFAGFLDFYPTMIASELQKKGIAVEIAPIRMEALQRLRKNPTEMRSANIALVFDKESNLNELAGLLNRLASNTEAIVLPAVFGLDNVKAIEYLKYKVDKPIYLISTLTPSVPGIRLQKRMQNYFVQLGGIYMLGDTVLRVEEGSKEHFRLYSANHGDVPIEAEKVVLASGSFFSKGLVATPKRIYEPIMDLTVRHDTDRSAWYEDSVFGNHRYLSYGIQTDSQFRAMKDQKVLPNVYVVGAGLEGFNPIKEGCGAGVSMLTALFVAKQL